MALQTAEDRMYYGFQYTIKTLNTLGVNMAKFINQTGKRFGRLLVQQHMGRNRSFKQLWRCLCDCGKEAVVTTQELNNGHTTSCGCYLKERITKHGGWNKGSYNTWRAMMRRCYNPKDKDYRNYGAVGIKVYLGWHDYLAFADAIGEPQGDETLDRIDPYGDYTPHNCRWASIPTQARNKRLSKKSKTGHTGVSEVYEGRWMAKLSINKKAFYSKVFSSLEEAVAARKELERIHWGVG